LDAVHPEQLLKVPKHFDLTHFEHLELVGFRHENLHLLFMQRPALAKQVEQLGENPIPLIHF
jgi:hypothetical protein